MCILKARSPALGDGPKDGQGRVLIHYSSIPVSGDLIQGWGTLAFTAHVSGHRGVCGAVKHTTALYKHLRRVRNCAVCYGVYTALL